MKKKKKVEEEEKEEGKKKKKNFHVSLIDKFIRIHFFVITNSLFLNY